MDQSKEESRLPIGANIVVHLGRVAQMPTFESANASSIDGVRLLPASQPVGVTTYERNSKVEAVVSHRLATMFGNTFAVVSKYVTISSNWRLVIFMPLEPRLLVFIEHVRIVHVIRQ